MDKLSKAVVVSMAVMLIIILAAGGKITIGTKAPADNRPTEPPMDPPIEESASYHVGIVTKDNHEDEIQGAKALVAQYGSVDKGGIIKHVISYEGFAGDLEFDIMQITGLANDPLMKAVIVSPGTPGTATAFQRIREAGRDDMLFMAVLPYYYDPNLILAADVIIDTDVAVRGFYDILRAKNMGATTFVFMSFQRHMDIEILSRRRNIYEEACKDLALEFVFETVPDPAMADLGATAAQQQVYDMMPDLVEKYGEDTVFFTTNTALLEPVIKRVVELGAMFSNQEDMSPVYGYPTALELDLSAEIGDWPAIVSKIEEAVVAKGMSGRMGTWPYSFNYCNTIGLAQLAMNMIEGKGTGNVQNDIIATYQALTPGCEWMAQVCEDPDSGQKISNYYLLSMDTYIFGQGYSGVFSEPVPEKYYRIK